MTGRPSDFFMTARREGELVVVDIRRDLSDDGAYVTLRLTDRRASEAAVALLTASAEAFDARLQLGLVGRAHLKINGGGVIA